MEFSSFEEITIKGLGDPTIFSGGIAVALITTIAGIIVSIPHQIAYNHFISLVDKIEIKAKKELLKEENRWNEESIWDLI